MNKQSRTIFFLAIALIGILALVLFLLFIPDMSATLIDTVPEFPPELHNSDSNSSEAPVAVTVDRQNVKQIVSALSRPSEYFSETQSTLSHTTGSATYSRNKWVKGKLSRVDVLSAQQSATIHYVYTDNSVFIWKSNDRAYHKANRGDFDADDAQMMMSYEDLLLVNDEDIITAGLTMYDGVSCIYAEAKKTDTGYIERYWVSFSTGLLVFGQTLDENGNIIYSITSTKTDVSPQSEDLFRLPDGNLPT